MKEQAYDFRKRLLQVHEPKIRDFEKQPAADDFILRDGMVVEVSENADEVMDTAAQDFIDFLSVSMGISEEIRQ